MATAFSPQERERIRDSLLDAALKSAATQGMRHATVDGLAREAGISKGAEALLIGAAIALGTALGLGVTGLIGGGGAL